MDSVLVDGYLGSERPVESSVCGAHKRGESKMKRNMTTITLLISTAIVGCIIWLVLLWWQSPHEVKFYMLHKVGDNTTIGRLITVRASNGFVRFPSVLVSGCDPHVPKVWFENRKRHRLDSTEETLPSGERIWWVTVNPMK